MNAGANPSTESDSLQEGRRFNRSRWRAALVGVLVTVLALVVVLLVVFLGIQVYQAALVVVAVAFFPITYLAFELRSESHKERLVSGLALLGFGSEEASRLENLYNQIYSQQQFLLFVGLASLSTLLGFGLLYISSLDLTNKLALFDALIARTMFYSFLGAYVFSIYNVTRRFVTYDLQPGVFLNVTVLMLTVMILGFIIALGFRNTSLPMLIPGGNAQPVAYERWIPIIAFLIGYIPETGIRWLSTIGSRILPSDKRLELRLSNINGISIWHETRLRESGIDNVQNLAGADVRKLLLTSRFNVPQVLNWVDQAVLLITLPLEVVAQLRDRGVGSMSALLNLLEQPDQTLRPVLKMDGLDGDGLKSVYKAAQMSAETAPNLPYVLALWKAIKKYDTSQVEASLQSSLGSQSKAWAELDFSNPQEVEQLSNLMSALHLSPEELESLFPDTVEALVGLGNVYNTLGTPIGYLQAERVLNEAIAADESYVPAYVGRGVSYFRQGKTEQAVADLQRAIKLDPAYSQTYVTLGSILLSMQDFQGALDVLDDAINLNPILPAAYLNRGRAHRNLDKLEAAKADLIRAAELASYTGAVSVQIDASYQYGQLCLEQKALSLAIQKFNEVIRLDRTRPLGYLRLGQAYLAARNYSWAVFNLTTASEILESDPNTMHSPDLAQAYSDLGQAFYGLDQAAEALFNAGRAIELGDQRPINFKVKGLSHLKLKEPDKAIKSLKDYLNNAPDAADASSIQQVIDRLSAPPEAK